MSSPLAIPATLQEVTEEWFSQALATSSAPHPSPATITTISPAFAQPKGFLSTHVRVQTSEASFFIKLNPSDPRYLDFLRRSRYDHLESAFYSVIVEKGIKTLLSLPGLDSRPRPLPIPRTVFVASEPLCSSSPKSVIVFRDEYVEGFSTLDTSLEWSGQMLTLAAQALARLNALCFCLTRTSLTSSPEIKETLKLFEFNDSCFDIMVDRASDMSQVTLSLIRSSAKDFEEETESFLTSFQSFLRQNRQTLIRNVKSCKFACLTQRDAWNNNFLWKFRDKNDHFSEPVDVLICDWQLAKIFNPLADLSFLMLTCCNSETRSSWDEKVVFSYFEAFCSVLKAVDPGSEGSRFTFDDFLSSYRKDGVFWGLFNLIFLAPAVADLPECNSGSGDEIKIRNCADGGVFLSRYVESVLEATQRVLDNVRSGAWLM